MKFPGTQYISVMLFLLFACGTVQKDNKTQPFKIINTTLARHIHAQDNKCVPINPSTAFSTTDEEAIYHVQYVNLTGKHQEKRRMTDRSCPEWPRVMPMPGRNWCSNTAIWSTRSFEISCRMSMRPMMLTRRCLSRYGNLRGRSGGRRMPRAGSPRLRQGRAI